MCKRILVNKIRCNQCGDVLESHFTHDSKFCSCGESYVDGGRDYIRRIADADYEELSVFEEITDERMG